jgi:excisionase family DNA binding protein
VKGDSKKGDSNREPMMTVAEVSTYLSLSARSVYKLVGDLRALRIGGRWRFRASDVDQWILKQRTASETQIEPVEELGSQTRLFPHMDEANIFLDVADSEASSLIRNAIDRARLELTEGPDAKAKERIYASLMEREALCSTALHPEVAFPHPRDPEKCPLGRDHIVLIRAAQPVNFGDTNGHRPRIVFLLLARAVSLQLQWEARLSHLLHRKGFVEKMLSAASARGFHELFAPSSPDSATAGT